MKRLNLKINRPFLLGLILTIALFTIPLGTVFSQEAALIRLQTGIELYSQGRWRDAVLVLRRAQAEAASDELRGEALFWISLAQISAGEHGEALRTMDTLMETDPVSYRLEELSYHRGRTLFHLQNYDEAILVLAGYANSFYPGPSGYLDREDGSKKAAALYWIGESLFAMGQIERAQDIFMQITGEYPFSSKYEASVFRLAMIEQKKIEVELLALLRWSHEEALRNMEEFQRRESFYDQALSAYQRRIAELLGSGEGQDRLLELENENVLYRARLAAAEDRIRSLESTLRETNETLDSIRGYSQSERLESMRSSAEELERTIRGIQ